MVAVPGRSKGCHTCRKRRIKCGERKPSCQRCSKAGYTCAGYERPLEFRHASTARFLSSTKPDGTSEKGIPGPASSTAVAARPRLFSPPPELSLVAFQEDMYTAFLVANFVWRSYDTPWIEMATKGNLGQLSLHASQALSQTNFGSAHHQEEIKLDGMTQYSKVLKALAPQLSDPRRPGVEELIVPVMMLLIHASSQADLNGSISHIKGLTQLLYLCGPQRFQRDPLRHAFESCRATLVRSLTAWLVLVFPILNVNSKTTVGLITRQRSLLEQDHWRTVPWALDSSAQSAQSRLVNILILVPGFLEDDTRLDREFDFELLQYLVQRLKFQLEQLFKWRWRWEGENPHAAWEEESDREAPVGWAIRFATLLQAVEIMTYNSVLIWILGLLWKLDPLHIYSIVMDAAGHAQDPSSCRYTTLGPLHLPGEAIQLRDVAVEICKAFDFQIRNIKDNSVSSLFFLMPIGLAWSALEHEEEWKRFISEGLATSHVTRGYQTGKNVFGFGSHAIPSLSGDGETATLWLSHSEQSAWQIRTAAREEMGGTTSSISNR